MYFRFLLIALATASFTAEAQPKIDSTSVAKHYGELVHATYEDTLAAAKDMQGAIRAFLKNPSEETHAAARAAWLSARTYYGQTEAFRFYDGPIEDKEGEVNAWPLDESYIDYVEGKPGSGLINNPKFKISKASIAKFNERGGEENIAAGWHAIEFLLWGQDRSETGPGDRSYKDYANDTPHADRRRQYLDTVTDMLVDDLTKVASAWAPEKKNYRARFSMGGKESIRKIIVGMGSLSRGELAGERMEVALNSQDQEDEHSCFSDNTHNDIIANATGIRNIWLGQYKLRDGSVLKGPSVRDLVAAIKPDLAEKTTSQVEQSLQSAQAIEAPFDREIIGKADAPGRQRVQKTINSLVQQSQLLVESAKAVGIEKLMLVQP